MSTPHHVKNLKGMVCIAMGGQKGKTRLPGWPFWERVAIQIPAPTKAIVFFSHSHWRCVSRFGSRFGRFGFLRHLASRSDLPTDLTDPPITKAGFASMQSPPPSRRCQELQVVKRFSLVGFGYGLELGNTDSVLAILNSVLPIHIVGFPTQM